MTTAKTTSMEPQFRTIDGVKIRYADSGGANQPVVLLTSPWPESIYAFAPMWETLAEHAAPLRRRPSGVRRVRAPC